jgi:hypothetical protein
MQVYPMKLKHMFVAVFLASIQPAAFAATSLFCPQHYGNISLGMTEAQVIAACGEPLKKQESNKPIMRRVPMQQMTFNNAGTPKASSNIPVSPNAIYYGLWNNPVAISGMQIKVDVVDNKIYAIQLNSTEDNGFSICGGPPIAVGDPVSKILSVCGAPLVTNNTFIEQVVETEKPPEVWIYSMGQYQAPVSLTFSEGKLQSIQ